MLQIKTAERCACILVLNRELHWVCGTLSCNMAILPALKAPQL
jgi:hypothetical protein